MKTKMKRDSKTVTSTLTRRSFKSKYHDLCRKTQRMLREYGRAFIESGAVDLSQEEDNYRLVKNVLVAACEDSSFQWGAPSHDVRAKRQIKRIRSATVPNYLNAS